MTLSERTDVVIVGGGFAGAATAFFLGAAGVRNVLLLEREAICGAHASGKNAALCRQVAEDDVITRLTVRGADLLRTPPPELAPVPLVTTSGSLLLASSAETANNVNIQAAACGVAFGWLSPEQTIARFPILSATNHSFAAWFPEGGVIHIHELLQAYLSAARRAGARVETSCEVLRIDPKDACVETSQGPVRFRCVVIAAGAWADEVGGRAGLMPLGFRPYRRHLFVTGAQDLLKRDAPFVWHLDEGFYFRPEQDALLLSACDEAPAVSPEVAEDAHDFLAERTIAVVPSLAELPIRRAWACLRTFAPSRQPVIRWDSSSPRVFWVAGLGGHGATASAAVGELAAMRIAGRLPEL